MKITSEEMARLSPQLSVGLHAGNVLRLGDELDALHRAGVRLVHLDVMDGVFCPGMTFGPAVVAAVGDHFVKDVHLMVHEPLSKLDAYVEAGASIITFHLESTHHPHRALVALSGSGVLRGIALNPGTPVEWLQPILDELEYVLVLSIDPGWGGQRLALNTGSRIQLVRQVAAPRRTLVGVDGAVTRENAKAVASLGADVIVSGSAVFAGGESETGARFMVQAIASASRGEDG